MHSSGLRVSRAWERCVVDPRGRLRDARWIRAEGLKDVQGSGDRVRVQGQGAGLGTGWGFRDRVGQFRGAGDHQSEDVMEVLYIIANCRTAPGLQLAIM